MNNQELIERAMKQNDIPSQRELAKRLNLNNSSLSLLRNGKGELSDETYVKLAELAGIDPALVIIEKHERKAGAESRKVWERLRHALAKSGSVLIVAMIPMGHMTEINDLQTAQIHNALPILGIMRHKGRHLGASFGRRPAGQSTL